MPLALAAAPRETDTVRLIRQIEPAVVAIFTQEPGRSDGATGSGVIIHEDGFILTCDHVVRNQPGVVLLSDGSVLRYQNVGRMPEKDLAVIRVAGPKKFPAVPLGRSHDLMIGEPVLCGGNPGGRGIVFSSGIISSPGIFVNAPNALFMSQFTDTARDRFIQFDAASNKGNSGGPLFNAEGRVIGVVSQKIMASENINFAIPADRVRKFFADMVAPEETGGFWLGARMDLLADRAVVADVAAGSPAALAGLRAADVLVKLRSRSLRSGTDWVLLLAGAKPGESLVVEYERDGKPTKASLALASYPRSEPHSAGGKQPGLKYQLFPTPRLTRLPDFSTLSASAAGVAATLDTAALAGERKQDFALLFEGFLRIPSAGLHRIILRSDDGSRLLLNGTLLVDNDGNHGSMDIGRRVRLAAGLHAIRLEYFQASSSQELKLLFEAPDGKVAEAGAESFFHQ
ncbi:MAG: trypsin-like peptidase domain-containing protein [Verrucomicrobia bacterium]|nr:trypsin-like peptidase domain-containing protein [Verrucomicrobiota bacterium]